MAPPAALFNRPLQGSEPFDAGFPVFLQEGQLQVDGQVVHGVEQAGRPDGSHVANWLQAEAQLEKE